jgi:hypothetical protein
VGRTYQIIAQADGRIRGFHGPEGPQRGEMSKFMSHSWRAACGDSCQVLDVTKLLREARRRMGQTRQWQANQVSISYWVRGAGGRWEDVTLPVRLTIPDRLRPARRGAPLPRGPYFCAVAAASPTPARTRMPLLARPARRKIERRLGGSPDWAASFPPKSKRACGRGRMSDCAVATERRADETLFARFRSQRAHTRRTGYW